MDCNREGSVVLRKPRIRVVLLLEDVVLLLGNFRPAIGLLSDDIASDIYSEYSQTIVAERVSAIMCLPQFICGVPHLQPRPRIVCKTHTHYTILNNNFVTFSAKAYTRLL